jgi:hypothetical protein
VAKQASGGAFEGCYSFGYFSLKKSDKEILFTFSQNAMQFVKFKACQ